MNSARARTKSGKTVYLPIVDETFETALIEDGSTGFCIACGQEAYGVEPDAQKYECESCGEHKVYGLEELCLMGFTR